MKANTKVSVQTGNDHMLLRGIERGLFQNLFSIISDTFLSSTVKAAGVGLSVLASTLLELKKL